MLSNTHAVVTVKYSSCIYYVAEVVIKAAFAIAHSSVIVVISVAAVATRNDTAVANDALVIVICLVVVFNDTAGAVVNIGADTESNNATVTVISIAKIQIFNVASVAVANAAAVALMYFAAVAVINVAAGGDCSCIYNQIIVPAAGHGSRLRPLGVYVQV